MRFDRRRCDSCDSGAYQASPALSLSVSGWVGGFLHVRAWYGGWVVAFWLMGFGWRYGRLGFGIGVDVNVGVGVQWFGCWWVWFDSGDGGSGGSAIWFGSRDNAG